MSRRLILLSVALGIGAPCFPNSLGIQNIQSPDCNAVQFQVFCAQQASATDFASLTAGTLSQRTGGSLSDQILVGIPPRTLIADATASGSTSFSGIHSTLSADGAYDPPSGTGLGASATYLGQIQDYLLTSSKVPAGDLWQIGFTLSASGNSSHHPLDIGDNYTTTVNMSIGIPGAVISCPTGSGGGELTGSVFYNCVATVPVTPLSIVSVLFDAYSYAASDKGPATLDMSHTAMIDYVEITDSQGNPDLSADIFDRSGYNYNVATTAVPEPSSVALLFAGVVLLSLAYGVRSKVARRVRYLIYNSQIQLTGMRH